VLAFAGFAVSFGPSLVKPREHAWRVMPNTVDIYLALSNGTRNWRALTTGHTIMPAPSWFAISRVQTRTQEQ
jgi:hypothetical protein